MTWLGTKVFNELSSYNAEADFNRAGINLQHIKQMLEDNGYPIVLSKPIEVASREWFPTVTRINGLRQNIIDLINGYYHPIGTPAIEINMARKQKFDYIEANKIEANIQGIHNMVTSMIDSYLYCGAFYCGHEGGDLVVI